MVREELTQMDREVPLSQVTTLSRALDATVAAPRMRANLLGLFAALAMILAAIGVYGVVAYMVGQRTQEIGVRRALGAKAVDVMMMLMREAMRPVAIGIVNRRRRRIRDDAPAGGDAVRDLGHRCDDLPGRVRRSRDRRITRVDHSSPTRARQSIRSRPYAANDASSVALRSCGLAVFGP